MTIEISEAAGVRSLHFGTPWIQGAMRIARPWALELEYTRHMMLPLLLADDASWPGDVLMIGLGGGAMAKFLHRHRPLCRMTVVEIDAQVIQAAHHHFRVPVGDQRLQIVCADGFDWVQADLLQYDLILVDGFDPHARAHRLESEAFYQACRSRLKAQGWLCCNLLTLHRSHAATRRHLRSAFGDGQRLLPPCSDGNVVAMATVAGWTRLDPATLRHAAVELRRSTQLNLLPLVGRLPEISGA